MIRQVQMVLCHKIVFPMLQRLLYLLTVLVVFQTLSQAQITQINPYYGIQLPMVMRTYNGDFKTDGGNNFGLNVSFGQWTSENDFSKNLFFELQYNYNKSPLTYYYYYTGGFEDLGDLKMHNGLLGVLKGAGNEIFEGYAGLYAGVTVFDVEDPEAFDYTRFTMSLGAGIKYYVTPVIGIRLHSQFYLPFWASSTYLGWSGGTNSGSISSIASPYMNFNVGIFANIDQSY
jgi:hypothetical protein